MKYDINKIINLEASLKSKRGKVDVAGIPIKYRFHYMIGSMNDYESCIGFSIEDDDFVLDFSETKQKTCIYGFLASNGIDYAHNGEFNMQKLSKDYPIFVSSLVYFFPSGLLRYAVKDTVCKIAKENDLVYKGGKPVTEHNITMDRYLFDADSIISGPGFSLELDKGFYMCKKCQQILYNEYIEVDEDCTVEKCRNCEYWEDAYT